MITARKLRLAASLSVAALALAACDSNSLSGGFRDLEHVKPADPDKAILINNVDGFPNVTIVCVQGVALVTTTRDSSQAALQHFDALDKVCPGYAAPAAR